MKRTSIGAGAYVDQAGRYWERPGGKTWRLMRSVTTQREARRIASARDPYSIGRKFAALARLYIDARCPDATLKPREVAFTADEIARVEKLIEYFGTKSADKISIADIPAYYAHRVAQMPEGLTGNRQVDKETQTLSNIYRYAVAARLFPTNPVSSGRPRYQVAEMIRHSRVRAPKTADNIHKLAAHLFETVETEVTGWFCLFAMFSGCRISELLRLRTDAIDENFGGFIQWRQDDREDKNLPLGLLHLGQRSKHGLNPEVIIGNEFADCIRAWQQWHAARFPSSRVFFPRPDGKPISRRIIHRHIAAAGKKLELPLVTPHGFRSFYVTKRRSDGATDTVIAGEIGDKTVALMQTTYGARPKNWLGGEALRWLPKTDPAAWTVWKTENPSRIDFLLTTGKPTNSNPPIESTMPVWRNGRRTGLKILPDHIRKNLMRTFAPYSLSFLKSLAENP